jgi:hypothetical protein
MNCIASIAAVIGLSIQPMQASFQSSYIVIEHSICGGNGIERGIIRVPRNRQNPIEHDPSQSMACAHALRPNGSFDSDDACEDAEEN